jgi:spore coat protein SA
MRVLHVCPYFLPSEGGSERAVFYISKETSKLGVQNIIVTLNTLAYCVPSSNNDHDILKLPRRLLAYRTAGLPEREWLGDVLVMRFPYLGLGYSQNTYARVFSPRMVAIAKSFIPRCSIVHFHTVGFIEMSLLLSIVCRKWKVPYLVQVHGIHEVQDKLLRSNYLIKTVGKCILKEFLIHANKIIAITRADFKPLLMLGIDLSKVRVVPYGVDLSKFEYNSAKLFEKGKKCKKKLRILFMGTIAPNKGVEILVEALHMMPKEILNRIQVDLAGDTSRFPVYVKKIKNLIRKYHLTNIRFLGQIEHEKVVKEYHSSDIFVFPSTSDSFGIVNIEAMAAGLPIIASRVGGVETFIKNGYNGLTVPPNDPKSLKDALVKLILDHNLRRLLALNGQRFVFAEMSWSQVAIKIKKIYDEVIAHTS